MDDDTLAGTHSLDETLAGAAAPLDDTLAAGANLQTGPSRSRADRARGDTIGRYVVLSKLGAGGMGVVYAAYDPELDRKVALKLLLGDSSDPAEAVGRARLVREAQALAKLSHPHVVAVHDVGEHEGDVWIAMEFVEGQTLSDWLAAAPRDWRSALSVLRAAGEGIAAAHAKGMLHRDVKPDNIMVASDGRVRVMDFGLARGDGATSREVAVDAATVDSPELGRLAVEVTRAGAVIGTPAYMAPEQLRGAELTAAADQFAFCVTCWEALHGERPFGGDTLIELAANVITGKLRPPRREIPSWLDAAIRKGLTGDPAGRHADMPTLLAALASGEVQARRRRGVVAAGLALASLGALVGGAVGYERWDLAERTQACVEAGAVIEQDWNDAVRAELRDGLLATKVSYAATTADKVLPYFDAQAAAWREASTQACTSARVDGTWSEDLLDRANWCLDERRMELVALADELAHADEESVQKAIAAAAGMATVAPCVDERRLERLPALPADRAAVRAVREQLSKGAALRSAGRYTDALSVSEAVLADAQRLAWPPLVAAASLLHGRVLERSGDYANAEKTLEDAYFLAVDASAVEVAAEAATELVLTVGERLERGSEARRWARLANAAFNALAEPEASVVRAPLANNLGLVAMRDSKPEEAKAAHERALAIFEAVLGQDHPDVAAVLGNLSTVFIELGKYEEAIRVGERSLEVQTQALGPEHPQLAFVQVTLAIAYSKQGNNKDAIVWFERALALRERALGPEHPLVGNSLNNLAIAYDLLGEYEKAKEIQERALALLEKQFGPEHPRVANSLNNLGQVYANLGQIEQAKAHYARALSIREKVLEPTHTDIAITLINIGNLHRGLNELAEAASAYERARDIWERALGPDHPHLGVAYNNIASVHDKRGESDQAKAAWERSLAIREKALGPEHLDLTSPLLGLGRLEIKAGRPGEAIPLLERALAIRSAATIEPVAVADVKLVLAPALWDAPAEGGRDRPRARTLAEEARDALREVEAKAVALAEVEEWLAQHTL